MVPENLEQKHTLYRGLTDIVVLWTIFNIGLYIVLPYFGFQSSYNASPFIITIYYVLCALATLFYFSEIFKKWINQDSKIVIHSLIGLVSFIILFVLVNTLSYLPQLSTPKYFPYADIILSTPWYFLPKSIEIFIQQLLISVLVIELYAKYQSLKTVIFGYIFCFGSAHVLLFLLNGSSLDYSAFMTVSAVLSAFVFPYLMLKVSGGFLYSYIIHFTFYIILAAIFHLFPLPGYII